MISDIKKSKFPNNIYLEVIGNGVSWKNSDEITNLVNDNTVGAYVVMEILSYKYNSNALYERFVNLKTYKEIAETEGVSESKVSKMVASMIKEIQNDSKLYNFIRLGYNYTKRCM